MTHINLNLIFYTHAEHTLAKTFNPHKASYGKTNSPMQSIINAVQSLRNTKQFTVNIFSGSIK